MQRHRRVAFAFGLVLTAVVAGVGGSSGAAPRSSAVLVFWTAPAEENLQSSPTDSDEPHDIFLRRLERHSGLAIGFYSSSNGAYDRRQVLLDMTQGSRQVGSLYEPQDPPLLRAVPSGSGAIVQGWDGARRRAERVSVTLRPGLLAGTVPGGGGFVGVSGDLGAADGVIAAADERGHVEALSLGSSATLVERTRELLDAHRFVTVAVSADPAGRRALDDLLNGRRTGDLVLIAHVPPTPVEDSDLLPPPQRFIRLPAFAVARDDGSGSVTSATTRQDGLVASVDVLPTVLDHLGVAVPEEVRGSPVKVGDRLSADRLESLRRRWNDVRRGRQASSFTAVVTLSLLLLMLWGAIRGLDRALRPVLRIGGLAMLWWPTMVLVSAIAEPVSDLSERAFIASASVAAAALTDRLVRWPRGPMVPAVVGLAAYTLDLALGTDLLTRSVLGPSLLSGGRFFGVSNELEPLLPALLLVALAAVLTGRSRSRWLCLVFVASGAVLGIVVGWGRLGADVGGVLTVGGAFTVATLLLLPRGITRRSLAIAALVPFLALAALIAIDLGLSGGSHLSRNLTRSQGLTDLWELVSRRYQLAYGVLKTARSVTSLIPAVIAIAFAVRNRTWLYAPIRDPVWRAALLGGLAGGVVGALTNDSGPVLLINAVLALIAVTSYIQGTPNPTPTPATPAEPIDSRPKRRASAGRWTALRQHMSASDGRAGV
ncbi:MAG: hypothetical protein WKF43_03815 [Acidimicrobiales bacterium]